MNHDHYIIDGYLVAIGNGSGGTEITADEYAELLAIIHSKPTAESGFDYRLREDLEWELYELPPVPEDDDISDTEALEIIRGGEA